MSDKTRIYFGAPDSEYVETTRAVDDVARLMQFSLGQNKVVEIHDGLWVNANHVAFVLRIPERKD